MFKQIVRFAKSTLLTPKYERQPDPRQKKNSLVQTYIDNNCIHAYDIRKRLYFEKQCVKYCQLMKKIIPKHLIHTQDNLHIRHFSNKGYPWNMFCRKQKAFNLKAEEYPSNTTAEVKQDSLGKVLKPKQDCEENITSDAHSCFGKGNTYADIIKQKTEKKRPDITEELAQSSGKSKKNKESYGMNYNQTKCCVIENDNANDDQLYVSRSEKSDLMNQRLDNLMATKCDMSNLCKNTKFIKPSNRTYILSPSKQISDDDNDREVQSHCDEGKIEHKKSCNHFQQCKTNNLEKNPCGEPPSMKRSQMLAKKFISCSDLKASLKKKCRNERRRSYDDDECCKKSNACGASESQMNVTKLVSCSEMQSGCAKISKRAKSRAKPCIARAYNVSALKVECHQPRKIVASKGFCSKEESSSKCLDENKNCMAKSCDPPSVKYESCSADKKQHTREITNCKSPEKRRCAKPISEKACHSKYKSVCGTEENSLSCKLPDFGTPSKMNKYTIGGSRRILDVNVDQSKTTGCECSPPVELPGNKKCAEKKSKVECGQPLASKNEKMYTINISTSEIVNKNRKRESCAEKGKEFKFKVKKSTIATCKINKKLRRRMKKRVIEVKYPWNTVPNYSQCLFEALADKEKKAKKEAAKKEARKLAATPNKCNYTIKSKKCKRKDTSRYRAVRPCKTALKRKLKKLTKLPKVTVLEQGNDKCFPWNTDTCDTPKSPPRARDTTIPKRPSLKTLRKLARQNQNCLQRMKLLAKCKEAKPTCNKNKCDHKQFSTRSSESGDASNPDVDDGCKCLYCGADVECKVCPGTCKAPGRHMKHTKKDILCNLCHIFHTRGSPAIRKYFKKFYKNKEYHLFTDAAFLDLQVFLRGSRLPQPKSNKKKSGK